MFKFNLILSIKQCHECEKWLPLSREYFRLSLTKKGSIYFRRECLDCTRLLHREAFSLRYLERGDRIKARMKKRYQEVLKVREYRKKSSREYHWKNREVVLSRKRARWMEKKLEILNENQANS